MKRIWRFFSSTTLTIVLAVLISLNTAWGSIVVINNREFFGMLDRMVLLPWFLAEGMEYPSLTLWIFTLIFLMTFFAINTLVCTIDRVYSIIKTKRPLRAFLPQLVHMGFIIALLGHLVGSVSGFRSYDNVVFKGDRANIKEKKGIAVRLDDLEVKTNSTGDMESLNTAITVFEDEKEVIAGSLTINDPLIYKGAAFYHSNHGTTLTGFILDVDGEGVKAGMGKTFKVKGREFLLSTLYPDFAVDKEGRPYSLSREFRNPHQEILGKDGKRGFLNLSRPGLSVKIGSSVITLKDYAIEPYVVLTVIKDQGIWFIGIGSLILVLAMAALLFSKDEKGELLTKKINGG